MKKRRWAGFSMVELMVVILVIIVLMGILIPVVVKARDRSRRTRCEGNLKQIGLALVMYAGDNTAYFPIIGKGNDFGPLDTARLADNDSALFACPSASVAYTSVNSSNYKYIGSGLKDDNITPYVISMAYDASGNHPKNNWITVLFLDSHVEGGIPDQPPGMWGND